MTVIMRYDVIILQNFYEYFWFPIAPGLTRKPEVDEILIAPYSEAYYRGKVTNIIGDQVTLEFVDYGDMTTVAVSECKELTPEINAVRHSRQNPKLQFYKF